MAQLFLEMAKCETEQLDTLIHRATEVAGCNSDDNLRDTLAALSSQIAPSSDPVDVASAGAAFGEALVEFVGMKWVMVFDEYGLDFGLQKPGLSLVCFPFDMIRKRVEQGQTLDLIDLLESTADALRSADAGVDENADFEQCVFGLDSVDIVAEHKDGTIALCLVTTGEMVDDPRTLRLLARKLATYEQFAEQEYPNRQIVIKVVAHELPGPMIQAWFDQQGARLREASIQFDVKVDAK